MYRAVKANDPSIEVIAIGMDENQGGADYHGVGTWCNFTFDEIPAATGELLEYIIQNEYQGSILKVVDGAVVLKTIEEL